MCAWWTDGEDYYETTCGNTFQFIDGVPEDNGFKFCPYCGEAIEVTKVGEEEMD